MQFSGSSRGNCWDPDSHPDGTFVFIVGFTVLCHHLGSLSDQLHDPDFIGIGNGKGLAGTAITMFCNQLPHYLDGLSGSAGPLQGDIDQTTVVNYACRIPELTSEI